MQSADFFCVLVSKFEKIEILSDLFVYIRKKVVPLHANCVPRNNRIVIPLTPTA